MDTATPGAGAAAVPSAPASPATPAATADGFEIRLLPAGGHFRCAPDQTVLDAAIAAGYWLPHSCRDGHCGTCRLDLGDGAISYDGAAAGATAIAETTTGQCLSCQARPRSDLVLDAPGVPAEPGRRIVQSGARVVEVNRPSADVAIVTLQVVQPEFSFEAGQYAEVVMRDGTRRCYSMANAPDGQGRVEWHVRRIEGGRFSAHVYDKLKARDLLRIEGPFGTFKLRAGDAPVVLLASGTGYAPIAALLATHGDELARRGAVLYWGGRRSEDLYGVSSVSEWEAAHPGVRIVPVLSEPAEPWAGRRGLVHQAVLDDLPDLSAHEVYACGNPLMIDAARASFTAEARLPTDNFFADAFLFKV